MLFRAKYGISAAVEYNREGTELKELIRTLNANALT